jgi:hypothetical protein
MRTFGKRTSRPRAYLPIRVSRFSLLALCVLARRENSIGNLRRLQLTLALQRGGRA